MRKKKSVQVIIRSLSTYSRLNELQYEYRLKSTQIFELFVSWIFQTSLLCRSPQNWHSMAHFSVLFPSDIVYALALNRSRDYDLQMPIGIRGQGLVISLLHSRF